MFELILQTCVNALIASSFTAIIAVGLVLIFGIMQIVNFAHGELYMAGAYALWYLYAENGVPFFAAALIAIVVAAAIGLCMERGLFRPMRGNLFGGLIVSIGMVFILQVLAMHFFGMGLMKNITPPFREVWNPFGLEGVALPHQRLIVVGVAGCLLILFWLFLKRTKLGWALRACTQNPEAAALQGISVDKFSMIAMAISAALAGAAGAVMAPLVVVNPYMGHSVIITAFIVIVVGGIGSLEGAILAAIVYSFFHTFVTTYLDGVLATILGLVLMLVVLMIKPTGIMGTGEKV